MRVICLGKPACKYQHIDAWTKWQICCAWRFPIHIVARIFYIFNFSTKWCTFCRWHFTMYIVANIFVLIEILSRFVTKHQTDINSASYKLMVWHTDIMSQPLINDQKRMGIGGFTMAADTLTGFCHVVNTDTFSHWYQTYPTIWQLCRQKQVSDAGISNYIPQFTYVDFVARRRYLRQG